jgi:AraC-like DNA-binding protein
MTDRLVTLLERFELRAHVFQAGPLDHASDYPPRPGVGYLHVLESGRLRITDGHREQHIVTAPCALLFTGVAAHALEPADDTVAMVCAAFEFGLGSGNPLLDALPEMTLLRLHEAGDLGNIAERLFIEADGDHCGRDAILDRLMEVCLIVFLRELMERRELKLGLLAGLADPKLAKAITALHGEPAKHWTLAMLATAAGMSRARFAARFRDVVGMTPGSYIAVWRLGLAQSLLLRGEAINVVAEAVGYASASALSRAFSAKFGRSPSAWLRGSRAAREPAR